MTGLFGMRADALKSALTFPSKCDAKYGNQEIRLTMEGDTFLRAYFWPVSKNRRSCHCKPHYQGMIGTTFELF
jgi:hypothetical protein